MAAVRARTPTRALALTLVLVLLAVAAAPLGLAGAHDSSDLDAYLLSTAIGLDARRDMQFAEAALRVQGRNVTWLHVPKCGSSFAIALYHYECPGTPTNLFDTPHGHGHGGGARPLPEGYITGGTRLGVKYPPAKYCPEASYRDIGHTPYHWWKHPPQLQFLRGDGTTTTFDPWVTMLRDPSQRIISGFHAGLHSMGMSKGLRAKMYRTVKTPAEYARFPGIAGCMTKMLIGHACASLHNVTFDDVALAKTILAERIAFVGLTGEWQASLDLFHAMTHTQCDRASTEGANLRPSASATKTTAGYDTSVLDGFVDEADEALYAFAVSLFKDRQRRYRTSRVSSVCD